MYWYFPSHMNTFIVHVATIILSIEYMCSLCKKFPYKCTRSKGIQMRNTLRLKIRIFDLDGLRCFESKTFKVKIVETVQI